MVILLKYGKNKLKKSLCKSKDKKTKRKKVKTWLST